MCVTWLHSKGNDREQVCGHNSLAWRLAGKSVHSFVGSELSLLKLGSVLVGLSGGVSNFSAQPKLPFFEVKCVF